MGAIKAQATTVKMGDGATPEVFTTIGGVTSFSGIDGEATEIDITSLTSTAKEYLVGLTDPGNMTLEVNYDPDDAQQTAVRTALDAGTLKNFEITLTDTTPTVITFSAYVKSFSISGGVDDKMNGSISLRISGSVTFT